MSSQGQSRTINHKVQKSGLDVSTSQAQPSNTNIS